ncbi:PAS2 [Scenedesmus sp. PABB004]|nr:PAS2 [Scenedesmus sp. PABB004]
MARPLLAAVLLLAALLASAAAGAGFDDATDACLAKVEAKARRQAVALAREAIACLPADDWAGLVKKLPTAAPDGGDGAAAAAAAAGPAASGKCGYQCGLCIAACMVDRLRVYPSKPELQHRPQPRRARIANGARARPLLPVPLLAPPLEPPSRTLRDATRAPGSCTRPPAAPQRQISGGAAQSAVRTLRAAAAPPGSGGAAGVRGSSDGGRSGVSRARGAGRPAGGRRGGGRGGSGARPARGLDPRQLTAMIKGAATLAELHQLIEQHAGSLDHIHLAAAASQLGQWARRGAVRTAGDEAAAQQLLRRVEEQLLQPALLQACDCRGLSNVVWAAGLCSYDGPLLTACLAALLEQLPRNDRPQHVSMALYGAAKAGVALQSGDVRRLVAAFAAQLPAASPQAVSNTLWAVAVLSEAPAQELEQLRPQLEELLAALARHAALLPQDVSNALLAAAKLGLAVPAAQLQQLLAALERSLAAAEPQAVANTLWAVATMRQALPAEQLEQLLTALAAQLSAAEPQDVCNALWACGQLRHLPSQLLAALTTRQPQLERLLASAKPQELANVALACAKLGHADERLLGPLLRTAAAQVHAGASWPEQALANTCWAVAVLDLRQCASELAVLARAASEQWGGVAAEGMQQLHQVQLWATDCGLQLPGGGGRPGLAGALAQQQLEACERAWAASLAETQEQQRRAPSRWLHDVAAALERLPVEWAAPPALEQRAAPDGACLVDIAATTAGGARLAVEADGPFHFRTDGGLTGETLFRNRALAARGYSLVVVPWFEWAELRGAAEQAVLLAALVRRALPMRAQPEPLHQRRRQRTGDGRAPPATPAADGGAPVDSRALPAGGTAPAAPAAAPEQRAAAAGGDAAPPGGAAPGGAAQADASGPWEASVQAAVTALQQRREAAAAQRAAAAGPLLQPQRAPAPPALREPGAQASDGGGAAAEGAGGPPVPLPRVGSCAGPTGLLSPYPCAPHAPAAAPPQQPSWASPLLSPPAPLLPAAGAPGAEAAPGRCSQAGAPAAAAAAEAAAAPGYWEDRYALPVAALSAVWPDPALVSLLLQQADCPHDAGLPAPLPPGAAAAAAATVAAAASPGTAAAAGSSAGAGAEGCEPPVLLPLAVPDALQRRTACGGGLSGRQLLAALRAAATRTAAATASAADAGAAGGVAGEPAAQQGVQQLAPACDEQLGSSFLLRLACPQLLVGHEGDWVQVPPPHLGHWAALGLGPASPGKTLMYTVLAPAGSAVLAAAFMRVRGRGARPRPHRARTARPHRARAPRPPGATERRCAPPRRPGAPAGPRGGVCRLRPGRDGPLPPPDQPPTPPLGAAGVAAAAAATAAAAAAAAASGGPARFEPHSLAGLAEAAAVIPVQGGGGGGGGGGSWLRGLLSAARGLQSRLLFAPPRLAFPPLAAVPRPDLGQPQAASLVVFVVVPDDDAAAVAAEGAWPAVPGRPRRGQQQEGRQQGQQAADVLLLRSFASVAQYLAPLGQPTSLAPLTSSGGSGGGGPAGDACGAVTPTAPAQPQRVADQAQCVAPQQAGDGHYLDAVGPARLPPTLVAAGGGGAAQDAPALARRQQSPLLACPSEAALRGLAMAAYAKVRAAAPPAEGGAVLFPAAAAEQQGTQEQPASQAHEAHGASPGSQLGGAAASPAGGGQASQVLPPWVANSPSLMTSACPRGGPRAAQPLGGAPLAEPLFVLAPAGDGTEPADGAAQHAPSLAGGEPADAAGGAQPQEQQRQEQQHVQQQQQQHVQQQHQQQQEQVLRRSLHAAYFWLPPAGAAEGEAGAAGAPGAGVPWLAVCWTDDRAELLQSRLVALPPALLAAAAAEPPGGAAAAALSRWVAGAVLAASLALAADLTTSTAGERALLSRLLVCRLGGLGPGEAAAWRGLLAALRDQAAAQMHWRQAAQQQQQQQQAQQGNAGSNTQVPAPGAPAADGQQLVAAAAGLLVGRAPAPGGDAAAVWRDLQQQLEASVASVAAAAAEALARRPGGGLQALMSPTSEPLAPPPQQQRRSAAGAPSLLEQSLLGQLAVASVLPDGPLYLGAASDLPEGPLLLLLPGLAAPGAGGATGGPDTASVVLAPPAAACDALVPGELDSARLLHVRLLATSGAAIPPSAWAAAARRLAAAPPAPARGGGLALALPGGGGAGQGAGSPGGAAELCLDLASPCGAPDVAASQARSPASLDLGGDPDGSQDGAEGPPAPPSPGAAAADAKRRACDAGGDDAAGGAKRPRLAGAGLGDAQPGAGVGAAAVADAAAELAALAVAGIAMHALAGHASSCAGGEGGGGGGDAGRASAAAAAAAGLLPPRGAAVQLPLHAAAAHSPRAPKAAPRSPAPQADDAAPPPLRRPTAAMGNAYLLAYNAALCAGWGYVLFLTYKTVLLEHGWTEEVFKAVDLPLKVSQTAAVMEVVHAAAGIVKSPVAITAMQVASRIWCLWGIVVPCADAVIPRGLLSPDTQAALGLPAWANINFITLMTAWGCSEVIRYGFFALKEALGTPPYAATWLRYSGFLPLYPLGVSSELTMAALALPAIRARGLWSVGLPNAWNWGFDYATLCVLIMLTYIPGLPQLYGYMLVQRRKVLGGGGAAAGGKRACRAGGAAGSSSTAAAPPMAPLGGLALALAAAGGNNLGKGLQKAATRGLPALTLARREVVLAYLSNPTWLLGLALDVGGGAAMLGALAAAPVSLVQPVAAFGLVLLAAFSHFVLQERLRPAQWRGAAVATLGIVGMGLSAGGGGSSSGSSQGDDGSAGAAAAGEAAAAAVAAEGSARAAAAAGPAAATAAGAPPPPARVLGCFVLLLALLALEVAWRQRRERAAAARRKRAGAAAGVGAAAAAEAAAAAADAAACGLEAGCCFGFSAAAARTGFELGRSLSWLLVPVGLAASAGLTSTGFVLQTRGFKHGSALVVCTTAAAASIVAGVLVGLTALGEALPASPRFKLLLLASWGATFAGIASMAAGEGGPSGPHGHAPPGGGAGGGLQLRERALAAARGALLALPRDARRRLPRRLQAWLGRGGGSSSSGGAPGGGGLWGLLARSSPRAADAVAAAAARGGSGALALADDGGPGLPGAQCEHAVRTGQLSCEPGPPPRRAAAPRHMTTAAEQGDATPAALPGSPAGLASAAASAQQERQQQQEQGGMAVQLAAAFPVGGAGLGGSLGGGGGAGRALQCGAQALGLSGPGGSQAAPTGSPGPSGPASLAGGGALGAACRPLGAGSPGGSPSASSAGGAPAGGAGSSPRRGPGRGAALAEPNHGGELPPLARELGVRVGALVRLFRADAEAEHEQPVWMVVNLQGKIKGSYTADKMLEFCRRGTLSAAQAVLGIDRNLPYVARQDLAFYRPLGQLLLGVAGGARYVPLADATLAALAQQGLPPAAWAPLVDEPAGEGLAGELAGLSLGGGGEGREGRAAAVAAAAARLRTALQRLCGVGGAGARPGGGGKAPLWLYLNHLGWCRGPFSGGKVMHAHLCGRLPRDTLVVAFEPDVPAASISGDVARWFRPLGVLLDNVAAGWAYNTVKWADVAAARGGAMAGQGAWQPLIYLGPGSPPPLVAAEQLAPPPAPPGGRPGEHHPHHQGGARGPPGGMAGAPGMVLMQARGEPWGAAPQQQLQRPAQWGMPAGEPAAQQQLLVGPGGVTYGPVPDGAVGSMHQVTAALLQQQQAAQQAQQQALLVAQQQGMAMAWQQHGAGGGGGYVAQPFGGQPGGFVQAGAQAAPGGWWQVGAPPTPPGISPFLTPPSGAGQAWPGGERGPLEFLQQQGPGAPAGGQGGFDMPGAQPGLVGGYGSGALPASGGMLMLLQQQQQQAQQTQAQQAQQQQQQATAGPSLAQGQWAAALDAGRASGGSGGFYAGAPGPAWPQQ